VLLGDVGPDDLFYGYAFLFALTVWVAGFGTFMSAIMPRAISAVATTYVTMLVAPNLLAVIPGLALAFLAIWQDPKVWIGPAVQIGKAEILVVWTFAAAGVLYVIVRAWWRQGALQRPGAAARHVRRVAIGIVAVLWMALWLAAPVSLLVRGGMLGPVTMGASLSPYFGAAAILEPSTVQSIASEMETVLTRATSGSTGGSSGSRGPSGPSALAGTGPPVSRLQVCAVLIGGMLLAGLAFWVLGAAALTIRRR
jgi:hypothetical protein